MDLNGFDANTVEPAESREPIPAGWYRVVISESEEKPTKAQTGSYLQVQLEVIDGDHAGRKAFDILNLNNPNKIAVEIAQRTLSSICRAVGVLAPRDSSDLHDKPMMAKIKVKPATKDDQGNVIYEARNEVAEYAPTDKGGTTTASPPAASSTPPWKR